ncbi:hypothetical protein, partial [Micrococcus luteus]|uniref:hypothetical protein n=1 Tax=Micrococcus luteus TaxID=1270 RepID=UPI001C92D7AD
MRMGEGVGWGEEVWGWGWLGLAGVGEGEVERRVRVVGEELVGAGHDDGVVVVEGDVEVLAAVVV